jgi:hypothetical protein
MISGAARGLLWRATSLMCSRRGRSAFQIAQQSIPRIVVEGAPGIQDLPEPDLDRTGPLSIFAALLSNLVSNVPAVLVFKFGEYARAGVPLTVLSLAAGVWMLN